jgi:hypothetical protein
MQIRDLGFYTSHDIFCMSLRLVTFSTVATACNRSQKLSVLTENASALE